MTPLPVNPPPFKRLSIVIPMWNEQEYVHRSVRVCKEAGERLEEAGLILDHELVLVDDASTDGTPELLDALAAEDEHLLVVHHPVNRKLGGTIKTGLGAATGDLVLYTDADLPFDMLELDRAVRIMRAYEADIVSAYRHDRTGEGPRRAVYSWVYNWLIQLSFGTRLRDINFAFKLMRRTVLDAVELRSEGSFIDAELLVRAQRLGFSVVQIGVDYFPRTRGVSTLSSPQVIGGIVAEMRQLRSELRALAPLAP
jgi:glycosyltransferase involved in cell wall biosynthesis